MLYQYTELDCAGISVSPPCPERCPVCNTCMHMSGCSHDGVQGEHRLPIKLMEGVTKALTIAPGIATANNTGSLRLRMHESVGSGRVSSGWRAYLGAINESR